MRTGAPWRDLPPDYGDWKNTHRRFIRWRDKGIWERLLEILIDDPDYEWLLIDATHCKVHPHAAHIPRRQSGYEPHKRGLNTKLHLAVEPVVCRSGLWLHKVKEQIVQRLAA